MTFVVTIKMESRDKDKSNGNDNILDSCRGFVSNDCSLIHGLRLMITTC